MKSFVIRFVQFTLAVVFGLALVLIMLSAFIQKKASFKLKNSAQLVVVGNSHPECAFNDSLISSFKNLSHSGEALHYTYVKIKKMIEQNSSVKVLFVEFNEIELGSSDDERIWKDKYVYQFYAHLVPFLETDDYTIVARKNPLGLVKGTFASVQNMTRRILRRDFDYARSMGGYQFLVRNKLDSGLNNGSIGDQAKEMNTGLYAIPALRKIICFCTSRGVKVYLVRSPLHEQFRRTFSEVPFRRAIEKEFKDVEFLDFGSFRAPDAEFGDYEHLNFRGAKRFSIWFQSLLEAGLLQAKDKQGLIDESINR